MNLNLSIGKRIFLGFGIIIISTILVFIITNNTLDKSTRINDNIREINTPSVSSLSELKLLLVTSKLLINNWVQFQSSSNHNDKIVLNKLTSETYPYLKQQIQDLSSNWKKEDSKKIREIFMKIDQLFSYHEEVKTYLSDFESYEDFINLASAQYMVNSDGVISILTNEIQNDLEVIITAQQNEANTATNDMIESFSLLKTLVKVLGFSLVLAALIIAIYTTNTIVRPVNSLKEILLDLALGVFPKKTLATSKDEIGEMTTALNKVISGLKQTKDFAFELGQGKFDTNYTPLSDQDVLGKALLTMRDELAENERVLEEKVKQRTAEVVQQKEEIELQSLKIGELYGQVTDSIQYAKRIQEAMLPIDKQLASYFDNFFVLFKPKDIVSGDFYWFSEKKDSIIIAAADCTGHGVPGAFMSLIGSSLLNQIVNENNITTPNLILNELRKGVIHALNKNDSDHETKDGMDIALVKIPKDKSYAEFSGAFNPLYVLRNEEIIEVKADRQPVGIYHSENNEGFTNHKVDLQKGDNLFIFSDGYVDQFGGEKGKKFKASRFKQLLVELNAKKLYRDELKYALDSSLLEWMGPHEQIDDVLVIGLEV